MPFTVSSQTVTTTIDCANATTDINGNGYRWDLSNKILALDGIDLRTSQMMGIELPPNSTITLQGDNYIEGASKAILFNIGSTEQDPGGTLTIKGDGTLTLNSTNTPSAILKFSFCMSALVRLLLGIGLYLSVFQAASGPLFIPVDFHIFC